MSFRRASKLYRDEGEDQVETLLFCMGAKESKKIFKTFKFEGNYPKVKSDGTVEQIEKKEDDVECVAYLFTNYFVPKVVKRYERARFMERRQAEGEPFEQFLRDLYDLIRTCGYSDEDDMLLDRIIQGIHDEGTKTKLELKADLDLAGAINICRQHELVQGQRQERQRQLEEVRKRQHSSTPRGRGGGRGRSRGGGPGRGRGQPSAKNNSQTSGEKCDRCGYSFHRGKTCPASGQTCKSCGGQGHFASMCRRRRAKQDEVEVEEVQQEFREFYLGEIKHQDCTSPDPGKPWTVCLQINENNVYFKIDSGADVSVMSYDVYRALKEKPSLRDTHMKLTSPGGEVKAEGEFTASTAFRGVKYSFNIVVVRTGANLLSRQVASRMNLICRLDETLGQMKTEPVKIVLRDDAVPYCQPTARRIPFPILKAVKAELDRMVKNGIIKPVTEPTDWCSAMVPVMKKTEEVRVCVDLKKLNKAVKREHFQLPNLDDIAPRLAGSTVYSCLDGASMFWQIPLDPESQLLTTFITPFGRFAFTRVPFGITSAPEILQRKMSEVLKNCEGCEVIMDDILIHGKGQAEHDRRLQAVLNAIEGAGITLNSKKSVLRRSEITFFGHLVGKDGLKPHPEKVQAIEQLPAPNNVSEVRTALGMFNYLGKFVPHLSTVLKPVSMLMKSDACWTWGPAQDKAFKEAKKLVSQATVLTYYDPRKPTVVSADASSFGLGAVLLQAQEGDGLKPIAFASRTLTAAEQRYAQIEKECLASVWACEKFAQYLTGLPSFKLLTDHKPLVPLMTTKTIDEVPIRCQRLLLRLMRFSPEVEHVPGKELVIADALSRKPLSYSEESTHQEIQAHVDAVQAYWPASNAKLSAMAQATHDDNTLRQVATHVMAGWPEHKSKVQPEVLPFYPARGELSIVDGLITYADRIVVPLALQQDTLSRLHQSHQGITKCLENAQASVWWPGINAQIKETVGACMKCRESRPSQPSEPLIPTELPDRAWQRLGMDMFKSKGQDFLVVIDYHSRWIELKSCTTTTSAAIINHLKVMFATHGIPETVVSDNGPQFYASDFKRFTEEWGIRHITSSPHFHQANGAAERAVRTAKAMLENDDPHQALLDYRATPHSATGVSPAEALMGRRLRTRLPVLPKLLKPQQPDQAALLASDEKAKRRYKESYDQRHGAKPLPGLETGQPVLIKLDDERRWTKAGVIQDRDDRTYLVRTQNGNVLRRNRRHLQAVPSLPPQLQEEDERDEFRLSAAPLSPPPQLQPSPPSPSITPPIRRATPVITPSTRRASSRLIVKPKRLIEDC